MTTAIVVAAVCLGWVGVAVVLVMRFVPAGEPRPRRLIHQPAFLARLAAWRPVLPSPAAWLRGACERRYPSHGRHALAGGER